MPRARTARLAPCGGAISPIIRSRNSWRLEGGAWPSFSHGFLEVVRAALGEGHRRLHHLAQRRALLGVAAGQRLVEVGAGGLGVVALGGAGAQQRLRGHAVLGLALELLVGARLELLDGRQRAHLHLLHLHLPLLGHAASFADGPRPRIRACPTPSTYPTARRTGPPSSRAGRGTPAASTPDRPARCSGREMDRAGGLDPARVARATFEILRPVPIAPLEVSAARRAPGAQRGAGGGLAERRRTPRSSAPARGGCG